MALEVVHPRLLAARLRRSRSLWAALAFGLAEVTTRPQLLGVRRRWRGWSCSGCSSSGVRRFRWPSVAAARARIDATLPGRPLAALRDTPALGRDDPGGAGGLGGAPRADAPARGHRPAGARRPAARAPRSLGAPAGGAGGADRRRRSSPATAGSRSVAAALQPAPGAAVATGPSFEGWAEPPAYTGRPTLYLPEVPGDDAGVGARGHQGDAARLWRAGALRARARRCRAARSAALAEAAPGIASAEFPVAPAATVTLRRGVGDARRLELRHGARPAAARSRSTGRAGARADRRDQARLHGARRPRHRRGAGRDRARPRARSTGATASRSTRSRGRRWSRTCRCRSPATAASSRRRWSRTSPSIPSPACR